MRVFAAGLLLCLASLGAEAKQSPYPPVTQFNGNRYAGKPVPTFKAQMGADVAKSVKAKQGAKPRRAAPARRHAPPRQRWRQVPIFAPYVGPGTVQPLSQNSASNDEGKRDISLGTGTWREAKRAVGGRPSGCPSRFCGCGASIHLFGRIIPALNLAANWLRFPRVAPAPRMAAARRGHVFVLEHHIAGNVWMVFDANSGGRRTRIHPRSIAGFTIVNPHGA